MTSPSNRIRFHVAHTPESASAYVLEALDSNENVNGSFTRRASEWIETEYGVQKVLLTHSATAALEMSAMILNVAQGATEVFMPSYTFSSTANAYLRAGYNLHFLDIDPATMTLDVEALLSMDVPNNSVVVPVHYAGNPDRLDEITEWAEQRQVWVVEDAAQALGVQLAGQYVGTFGVMSAISFHFTKNVHSSMGGALLINDAGLVDLATVIWERGTNRQAMLKGLVDKYSWIEVGSSFQTTELQAALLLAGLEDSKRITEHRARIWSIYADQLTGREADGLFTQRWRSDAVNNYHAFYVRLASAAAADSLRVTLRDAGIDAYIGYVPLHSAPYGVQSGYDTPLPQTERWADSVLRLPIHTHMTANDADRVARTILAWLSEG